MKKRMWRIWQLGTHSLVTLVVLVAVLAVLVVAGQKFWEANAENIQYSVFALRAAHFAYGMDRFYDSLPDVRPELEPTEEISDRPTFYWGQMTNSEVLTILSMTSLPYFTYEGIVEQPVIPRTIAFQPFAYGHEAMHIGGRASCTDRIFIVNWAWANRFDPRWTRDSLLGFVIHELGHVNGICSTHYMSAADIAEMESSNSLATIEIMAAMCAHGNAYACKPLAGELRSSAMEYVRMSVWGKPIPERLYYWFARYVIYNTAEERGRFNKSERYWNAPEHPSRAAYRAYVAYAYGGQPFYQASVALDKEVPWHKSPFYPNVYRAIKLDDLKWYLGNLHEVAQIAGRDSWPMRRWHGL